MAHGDDVELQGMTCLLLVRLVCNNGCLRHPLVSTLNSHSQTEFVWNKSKTLNSIVHPYFGDGKANLNIAVWSIYKNDLKLISMGQRQDTYFLHNENTHLIYFTQTHQVRILKCLTFFLCEVSNPKQETN